jgi:hypothetical protein
MTIIASMPPGITPGSSSFGYTLRHLAMVASSTLKSRVP